MSAPNGSASPAERAVDATSATREHEDWRASVLQGLLYALTAMSVIAVPVVVIQTETLGPPWYAVVAFISGSMLVATFVRSLGFRLRAALFLLAVYAFGAVGFARVGYVVGPTSAFVLIVVASGLLFGRSALWLALAGTTATIVVAGYLTVGTAGEHVSPVAMDVMLPGNWARMTVTFVLSTGVISLTVMYVVARIERALSERTASLAQLCEEQRQHALAQEQLELARTQLLQAQKLEAIGTLAGGVAHDFNNSLTIVRGWLDLLQRGQPGARGALLDEALPEIAKAVDHATDTTRQLLAFGRRGVRRPQPLHLRDELAAFDKTMRRLLPSDIEVSTQVAEVPAVLADSTQLHQALLNLAVNARDAMPAGGTLRIEAEHVAVLPPEVRGVGSEAPGAGWVAIRVRDSGSGMDAETAARAFEPFFTTKPEGKGTGLGLATVYGVVKQSGGHLRLESEPGRGTSVTLYLPVALSRAQAGGDALPAVGATSAARILVAEDEEGVRRIVVAVLEEAKHRVLAAHDSDSALVLVDEHAGQLDLLCTDGVMPGAGVKRLIERFKERNPEAAVLVCSGYLNEELVARGVSTGELAFLQKPFTAAELHRAVSELLARRPG